MAKEDVEYQDWLKEVEAGITDPEEKTAFVKFSGSEASRKVFRGHLREKDYYSRLNELATEKKAAEQEKQVLQEEVASWYAEESLKRTDAEKRAADLEKKLKAVGGEGDHIADNPTFARKEDLEAFRKQLGTYDQRLPIVMADLGRVIRRSIKEGYDIDEREVIKYATSNRVNAETAYEALTADARSKRADEDLEKRLSEARAEGERAALSKVSPSGSIRHSAPSSAVVEHLKNPTSREDRLKAAKDRFMNEFGGKSI